MRREVSFTVPGEPRGKGRHRMTRRGFAYTPKETVAYESLVKLSFGASAGDDWKPIVGECYVDITAFFSVPKSASKKKRALMLEGAINPTKKPDMSNILKIIEDGLNKVAFMDDSQVVSVVCAKRYGAAPGVRVRVSSSEEEP